MRKSFVNNPWIYLAFSLLVLTGCQVGFAADNNAVTYYQPNTPQLFTPNKMPVVPKPKVIKVVKRKTQPCITISRAAQSPTGVLTFGQNNATLASFKATVAKGCEGRISHWRFHIAENGTIDASKDITLYRLLMVSNGKMITISGPFDAQDKDPISNNGSGASVLLKNQFVLPEGDTILHLAANTSWNSTTHGSIQVYFNGKDISPFRVQRTNQLVKVTTDQSTVTSHIRSFGSEKVNITLKPTSKTIVDGSTCAQIGTVEISTMGSAGSVKLTELNFNMSSTSDLANLKLFNGNTQIGETEQPETSTTVLFNIDHPHTLQAGTITRLKLCSDVFTKKKIITISLKSASAIGANTGTSLKPFLRKATATVKVIDHGKLTVTRKPLMDQVTQGGSQGVTVAQYTLTAQHENVLIREWNFWAGLTKDPTKAANHLNIDSIDIYHGSTKLGSSSFYKNGTAYSSFDLTVPKGQSITITIKANIAALAPHGGTQQISIGLAGSDGTGKNWGKAGSYKILGQWQTSGLRTRKPTGTGAKIHGGGNLTIR
jgi:hypothetical protein